MDTHRHSYEKNCKLDKTYQDLCIQAAHVQHRYRNNSKKRLQVEIVECHHAYLLDGISVTLVTLKDEILENAVHHHHYCCDASFSAAANISRAEEESRPT